MRRFGTCELLPSHVLGIVWLCVLVEATRESESCECHFFIIIKKVVSLIKEWELVFVFVFVLFRSKRVLRTNNDGARYAGF